MNRPQGGENMRIAGFVMSIFINYVNRLTGKFIFSGFYLKVLHRGEYDFTADTLNKVSPQEMIILYCE